MLSKSITVYKTAFSDSFMIAWNRSATQIASMIIVSILGLTSSALLSAFSLALGFSAVIFSVVTSLQLGIQSLFCKLYAAQEYATLENTFVNTVHVVLLLSCGLGIVVWLIPAPFSSKADSSLAMHAYAALRVLTFSLPLVATLTTITFFLESIGQVKDVVKLRWRQVITQVGLVFAIIVLDRFSLLPFTLTAEYIAMGYVLSDMIILMMGMNLIKNSIDVKINISVFKIINSLFNQHDILIILKQGSPMILGSLLQRTVFYFYINYTASLGITQTTVFAIINSMLFMIQIPLTGIAHLLTIKISQSLGERNDAKMKLFITEYTMIFVIELLLIMMFFQYETPMLIRLFTNDPDVITLFMDNTQLVYLYFIMNTVLIYCMSFLRGYSDILVPQLIIAVMLTVGVVPCYLFSLTHVQFSNMLLYFICSGFTASILLTHRIASIKKTEGLNRISV